MAVLLAGLNIIIAAFFVAMLRPQSLLLITVPIVWGLCFCIARGEALRRNALLLVFASAVTANAHLFFMLTLAPSAVLWMYPPAKRSSTITAVAAIVVGWLTSPYSFYWLDVFRRNFAPNALIRPPSAISELQPGFVSIVSPSLNPMFALVAVMLALPWVLAGVSMQRRERLVFAIYWCVGLIGFGYATRLFVAWWLLSIVPVGWTLLHLTRNTTEAPPRVRFRLFGLVACVLLLVTEIARTRDLWALEGTTTSRTLPTVHTMPAERLSRWLESHTSERAGGKLLTSFTYGSYLTWRLPRYSASIDSRTIFPDSVAAAEGLVLASETGVPIGPWHSADLAIERVDTRVGTVLDTATGWRRMATVAGDPSAADSTALWVKIGWWNRHVTAEPRQ